MAPTTYFRQRQPTTKRAPVPKPPRALALAGTQQVLDTLLVPRFVDLTTAQVCATRLDEGTYLCSEHTVHRMLAAAVKVR